MASNNRTKRIVKTKNANQEQKRFECCAILFGIFRNLILEYNPANMRLDRYFFYKQVVKHVSSFEIKYKHREFMHSKYFPLSFET